MPKYLVTQTITFRDDAGWGDDFIVLDEETLVYRITHMLPLGRFSTLPAMLLYAIYVLWSARHCDGVSLGRYGTFYPALRRWIFGKKQRIFMSDTEWGEGSGKLNRLVARYADAIQANTNTEIERYSRHFRIPESKFLFLRVSYQDRDVFPPSDENYVFSGGRQARDWGALVKALGNTDHRVEVISDTFSEQIPFNFNVVDTLIKRHEFYQNIARSSCVVIPILREERRVTGMLTWTNAMAMGKVVIVTEPCGAPDYMDSGYNGFILDHGDHQGIRECVDRVMGDKVLREQVGRRARAAALDSFSPALFKRQIAGFLGSADS
jgi:hypothetical protein